MGSGASSVMRLRKALLMRCFNVKGQDQTLEERFSSFAFKENGRSVILVKDIKTALCLENGMGLCELFNSFVGDVEVVDFKEFIAFLESGKPISFSLSGLPTPQKRHPIGSQNSDNSKTSPPNPPDLHFRNRSPSPKKNVRNPTALPKSSILPSSPTASRLKDCNQDEATKNNLQLIKTVGTDVEVRGKTYNSKITVPSQPMWCKKEIVKQERIVYYTTVDAGGDVQELIETETQQTEVVHMECRETGEFAHRETTHFEQTETFNKELVNEQRGKEEYIHLKSQDDEYEFLDSDLPKKAAAPEEEATAEPPSSSYDPTSDDKHGMYEQEGIPLEEGRDRPEMDLEKEDYLSSKNMEGEFHEMREGHDEESAWKDGEASNYHHRSKYGRKSPYPMDWKDWAEKDPVSVSMEEMEMLASEKQDEEGLWSSKEFNRMEGMDNAPSVEYGIDRQGEWQYSGSFVSDNHDSSRFNSKSDQTHGTHRDDIGGDNMGGEDYGYGYGYDDREIPATWLEGPAAPAPPSPMNMGKITSRKDYQDLSPSPGLQEGSVVVSPMKGFADID